MKTYAFPLLLLGTLVLNACTTYPTPQDSNLIPVKSESQQPQAKPPISVTQGSSPFIVIGYVAYLDPKLRADYISEEEYPRLITLLQNRDAKADAKATAAKGEYYILYNGASSDEAVLRYPPFGRVGYPLGYQPPPNSLERLTDDKEVAELEDQSLLSKILSGCPSKHTQGWPQLGEAFGNYAVHWNQVMVLACAERMGLKKK
ncbi:hypothetical protein J9253_13560 [Thiothrix litoralis]|uniref:Lipoprotein n=1 Tax=Thiothrix litoralis TaxID=2891210 RepID=A0ABX7WRN6_9GAMM|nr:hypothetical protein [Thiothrix litoralis]QTR45033.1 hypothetical protein J9253_13560 [Thiothrix litoralis]